MQLDHTEIAIRQRPALELLDLSLLVLRRHWRKLCLTAALLGLPLLLLDVALTAWMFGEDALWASEHLEEPATALTWRHSMHLVLLYVLQFPLASLPCTIFLGNQIFFQAISVVEILGRLRGIAWRCIFVLGLLRFGLLGILYELLVRRDVAFDWFAEFVLLVLSTGAALLVRATMPFAPEILALELCPLRKRDKDTVSYRRRSRRLHNLLTAENLARFITISLFGSLLFCMLLGIQVWLVGITTGNWQWGWWCDHIALPVALWGVGLFAAVFRFLSYLDSRIRLEGWEIELKLKAEAARLSEIAEVDSGSQLPSDANRQEVAT